MHFTLGPNTFTYCKGLSEGERLNPPQLWPTHGPTSARTFWRVNDSDNYVYYVGTAPLEEQHLALTQAVLEDKVKTLPLKKVLGWKKKSEAYTKRFPIPPSSVDQFFTRLIWLEDYTGTPPGTKYFNLGRLANALYQPELTTTEE